MPACGALPVVGARLLSPYGMRRAGMHYGIDLRAPEGTPVHAVESGRVIRVAANGDIERYGITVVIDHGPWLSLSSHLSRADVAGGQVVQAGQRIGAVGRTAGTREDPGALFARDPPHLHLEFLSQWPVRGGGAARIDPAAILAELGILVPSRGPIFSACGTGEERVELLEEQPAPRRGAMDVLVAAVVLWALSRARA